MPRAPRAAQLRGNSIRRCEILEQPAREIGSRTMQDVPGPGYGIFAGKDLAWASLRFSAERARWVAAEQWQPQQKRRFGADDRYILGIPYADGRERIMDILKHGDHAEVFGPSPRPERVHEQIRRPHAPAPGAVALRNRPSAGEQPSTPVLP